MFVYGQLKVHIKHARQQDCSVKICDFGLSRAIEAAEQPHLHAPGTRATGHGLLECRTDGVCLSF